MKARQYWNNLYLIILFGIVLSVYLGLAYINSPPFFFRCTTEPTVSTLKWHVPTGYHQLLADAFLHNQLYLRLKPAPELLALSDPYHPLLNTLYRLHDASLYQEKFFLYFSPVIALLFELPIKILSGYYISESLLLALLCFTGFAFSFFSLQRLCRIANSLPSKPMLGMAALMLATATATGVIFLPLAPYVYQLCIASSYAFLMIALFLLLGALELNPKNTNKIQLLMAGLCLGLCFASRPNQLIACVVLILGFLVTHYLFFQKKLQERVIQIVLLGMPIILIGVAMCWYNYARFHSIFEFGITYQLGGGELTRDQYKLMSFYFIPMGLFLGLFQPWTINLSPPFLQLVSSPIIEFALPYPYFYGATLGLMYLPVYWLIIHPLFHLRRLVLSSPITKLYAYLLLAGFGSFCMISMMSGTTLRFLPDYLPMILLATLSLFFIFKKNTDPQNISDRIAFSAPLFYLCTVLTLIIIGTLAFKFHDNIMLEPFRNDIKNHSCRVWI